MSTIYVFDDEVSALATPASGDKILLADISAGTKKAATLSNVLSVLVTTPANTWTGTQTFTGAVVMNGNIDLGNATTDTIGFYGTTKVIQPASGNQAAITTGATETAHIVLTTAMRLALVNLGIMKGAA